MEGVIEACSPNRKQPGTPERNVDVGRQEVSSGCSDVLHEGLVYTRVTNLSKINLFYRIAEPRSMDGITRGD